MARELPKINIKRKLIREYRFSELLNKSFEELSNNTYPNVLIKDLDELVNNFDFFKKLFSLGCYTAVYSKDYRVLEYINEHFDKHITLNLIDDFENKDRSYIDLKSFEKSPIEIPLAYALWVNSTDKLNVNQTLSSDNLWPSAEYGVSPIKLDDLKKIREEIYKLSEKCEGLNDIEKMIIVSDYMQDKVQFIAENNRSVCNDKLYITKGSMPTPNNIGNISNILFNGFGVCRGISAATTALLNNPQMNVNVRDVRGGDHVWNVIKIGNKYYYLDNTWCITRNPDKYDESLKAKSFSSEYLLFGEDTANKILHHNPDCIIPSIEEKDYNRKMLDNMVKKLQYIAKYTDYEKPKYESYIQK